MPLDSDPDIGGVIDQTETPTQPTYPHLPQLGSGPDYVTQDQINAAAKTAGLDPDLFTRVVRRESGGRIDAVGPPTRYGRARGPAQIMDNPPADPQQNLLTGAKMLKGYIDKYGDVPRALAAYNSNPALVDQVGGVPNDPAIHSYINDIMSGAEAAYDRDAIGGAPDAIEPSIGAGGGADTGPPKPPYAGAVPVQLDGKFVRWAEPAQSAEIRRRAALPITDPQHFDINAELGSQTYPRAVAPGEDISDIKGGTWVMGPGGQVYQHQDPDSLLATLNQLGSDITNPAMIGFHAAMPGQIDPRAQAVESGFTNALTFGGKNYARARALQLATGGSEQAFQATLGQMNAQDAAMGQRFPIARGAGALGGTITGLGALEGVGGAALRGVGLALPETAEAVQGNALLRTGATFARRGAAGYAYGYPTGYFAPPATATEAQRETSAGQMGTTGAILNEILPGAGSAVRTGFKALGMGKQAVAKDAPNAVANALANAFARDDITPADAIAQARANPLAPAFHAGGYNVKQLADSAAQSPGAGAAIVRSAAEEHTAAIPAQIKADIGTSLGGRGDYLDALDAAKAARKDAADTQMQRLGPQPVTLDNHAVLALRSPVAQSALKEAASNALASVDPAERAEGANLNNIANTVLDNPGAATLTVRSSQNISKSMLDAAQSAYDSGNTARYVALKTLGKAIRNNAANSNPEYGAWLAKYGDDSDNISALQMGRKVFSGGMTNTAEGMAKELADMGPQAADYYQKGVAEGLIQQVRTQGVGAMRTLLRNEDIQDKVKMAFPDEASYSDFLSRMDQRVKEAATNVDITRGSPSYARIATRLDLEAQPPHPLQYVGHAVDVLHAFGGNPAPLTGRALKAITENIPVKDRSVIGDPVKNALLGQALTNPDVMEHLLSNYGPRSLKKIGGSSGGRNVPIPFTPSLIQGAARLTQKNVLTPAPAFGQPQ